MPEQTPLISVIIPVYNVGEFLLPCLDSLMAQSYKNLEILLIDDGSTDGSGDRCDAYAQKDSRFRVIHKENGGVSSARNLGLELAQGEYIAFIDADDWVLPDYFAVLYKNLTEQKVDATFCRHILVSESGEEVPCKVMRISEKKRIDDLATLLVSIELFGAVWGGLFTAATLKGHRFSGLRYAEDTHFMFQWLCTNPAVYLDPYPGYLYLQRQSSVRHSQKITRLTKAIDPLFVFSYAYLHLPVKTPEIQKLHLTRYALAVHYVAYSSVLPESRHAAKEDLKPHIQNILPDVHLLDKKLRAYILLYAKAPWLYNLIAIVHSLLKG